MKAKKTVAVIMAVLIAAALLAGAAAADAEYKNIGELYYAWFENRGSDYSKSPYPEAVCGVWSTDGTMEHLTVAVEKSEEGEALKQEILDLIEDDTSVTFTYMAYRYSELWAIQQKLTDRLGDETGAFGVGIDESENCLVIDIDTENPGSEKFMNECFEKYQNRVRFEAGSGVILEATSETGIGNFDTTGMDIGGTKGIKGGKAAAMGIAALLLLGGAAIAVRRSGAAAKRQLAEGGEETVQTAISRREAERIIKESAEEPDIPFEKISEKLDK
ncbi:MAG: hypothetical protein II784_03880 [Oscillospiraceae bacterium]|nr:hypothetical protein [Oscillospiraceae bacterium]